MAVVLFRQNIAYLLEYMRFIYVLKGDSRHMQNGSVAPLRHLVDIFERQRDDLIPQIIKQINSCEGLVDLAQFSAELAKSFPISTRPQLIEQMDEMIGRAMIKRVNSLEEISNIPPLHDFLTELRGFRSETYPGRIGEVLHIAWERFKILTERMIHPMPAEVFDLME